jgi:hypothetical protein
VAGGAGGMTDPARVSDPYEAIRDHERRLRFLEPRITGGTAASQLAARLAEMESSVLSLERGLDELRRELRHQGG